MACSSCSSGAPLNTLVPRNACGCSSTPAPPRVANPPTVPVKFEWVSRVRNFLCGRLAIFQKDGEIGALQSAFSGQVVFDAESQTVGVAQLATDNVNDNYGCQPAPLFGFPLLGLAPDCRDIGEYPPRSVAVARPTISQQGEILGALADCPRAPGLTPEIAIVKVAPKALDVGLSDGVLILPQTVGFTEEVSFDCAGSRQMRKKWYSFDRWMQPVVDPVTDADHLSGDNINLSITAWRDKTVGPTTTRELVKLTLAQLKAALDDGVVPPAPGITHTSPWFSIGYAVPDLSPSQVLMTFNPSTLPGYLPKYKTMWLQTRLIASSHGEDYQIDIRLGGQQIHLGIVREDAAHNLGLTVDFINPTYVFPFPVGTADLQVVKLVGLLGGHEAISPYEMGYELKLVGWQE